MRVHSAPTTPAPPSLGQVPLGEEVGAPAGLASPPPPVPPCGPTGRSSWAAEGERPAASVEGEREDDQQGEQKCPTACTTYVRIYGICMCMFTV